VKRGIIILAMIGAFLLGGWMMNFLNSDRCLDRGGIWDERGLGGVCLGIEPRQSR